MELANYLLFAALTGGAITGTWEAIKRCDVGYAGAFGVLSILSVVGLTLSFVS